MIANDKTHTIVAAKELLPWMEAFVGDNIMDIRLVHHGINDTYLVTSSRGRFAARLFRYDWRSRIQIAQEIEALNYLSLHRVMVASPVITSEQRWIQDISVAEGIRHLIVTHWAPGEVPVLGPESSAQLGVYLARLHKATESFDPMGHHLDLNFDTLLVQPYQHLLLHLHFQESQRILEDVIREFSDKVRWPRLEWGFLHGDFHDWNVHMDSQHHQVTAFDFDFCGWGYRAYDLAVFAWVVQTQYPNILSQVWPSFLNGYQSVRPLSAEDLDAVEVLVKMRRIWVMALYLQFPDAYGGAWWTPTAESRFIEAVRTS